MQETRAQAEKGKRDDMTIDPTKSINENYNALCVRFRELEKGRNAKTWVCLNCGRPESAHHYEKRQCTLYVTSAEFRAAEEREIEIVNRALTLLDGLLAIVEGG